MKKLLIALSLTALAGCSTSPTPSESAKKVPDQRILWTSAGNSTLVITRDSGWLAGGGCFVTAAIDGKAIARMDTGESVSVKIPSGRHILSVAGDSEGKGLCALQIGQPIKESVTEIKENEVQRFRITGDTGSGLELRPSNI